MFVCLLLLEAGFITQEAYILDMQVPKSGRCSLLSVPQAQGAETFACMTASVPAQVGRVSGLPGPGNKPLDCRAITRQEKVWPALSVLERNGFKITTTRPVPTPDHLIRFEKDLAEIFVLYRQGKCSEALCQATMLHESIPEKPENNDFIQYLNTVIFLCHVRQNMESCLHLPADNSEEFINWLLKIADLACQNTEDLPASSALMLFNWRWAADAGSQKARYWLAKVLLFAELCHDMSSMNLHFFPVEASRYLANMARDSAPLPEPVDEQEMVIHKMVELIKLRNTVDYDREKQEMVDFLRKQFRPEIQLLIIFIYTSDVFGDPDYDKARDALEQFHTLFGEMEPGSCLEKACRFCRIICDLGHDYSRMNIIKELYQLAQEDSLAAICYLTELSLVYEKIPSEYIEPFIENPGPSLIQYPDVTCNLYRYYKTRLEKALEVGGAQEQPPSQSKDGRKTADKQKKHRAKSKEAARAGNEQEQTASRIKHNATAFFSYTLFQGCPETRDMLLYYKFVSFFSEKNLRQIGKSKEAPPVDIQEIVRILNNSRYTQDPAISVYLHCAQIFMGVEDEQNLIEEAVQKNAISTCFHMLAISDATVTMDNIVLINKLLDIPGINAQDLLVWRNHLGFDVFLRQLRICAPLCRKPEQCLLLHMDLLRATGKPDRDNVDSLVLLAREKTRQNDIEQANCYYMQAMMLKQPSQPMKGACQVKPDYRIRRRGLPEYYQQLSSIGTNSSHPLEVRCRFNRLISVREQMEKNTDPVLWDVWVQKAIRFIVYSHWHTTPDMCQKLRDCCSQAIARQHTLSLQLLDDANQRLTDLERTVAGNSTITKSLDPVSRACQSQMKQTPTDSFRPLPEASSGIDNMAELPDPDSGCLDHTEHHHIIPAIQAAGSIGEVIKHCKQLSVEHRFDSTVLVRLVAPWFESAPVENASDIFGILSMLRNKLNKQMQLPDKILSYARCHLMWKVNFYCENFQGAVDQIMHKIIETTEKDKTDLFIHECETVLKTRKDTSSEEEPALFFWASHAHASPEEFHFRCFLTNIRSYHPRVLLKIFFRGNDQEREQCISRLQSIMAEDKHLAYFSEFFMYQLRGQENEMMSFLNRSLKVGVISDDDKAILLWYAYESSLITDDFLAKQITHLNKHSVWRSFLTFLCHDKHVMPSNKCRGFSHIMSLDRHYQDAYGFKLFSQGRLDDAASVWSKCQAAYPLAMLAWHHDIQPRTQPVDIEKQLQAAARKGQVKAQCELIHWLMKRQKEGEEINDCQASVACRFVHMPCPMAGGESILYQGITQYRGFGCEADPEAGKQKIQEALDKDPLVVALRLYDLKEQGLFALPDDPPTDYLLRYAQALSERDHDPYNRRDNYPANLLLSYGKNRLQRVLVSLRDRAGSGPSAHPAYQTAADRLGSWLDQWQDVAASSTRAPAKTLEVTACMKKDVEQVLNRATEDNWQTATLREISELTRKLRSGSKTGLDVESQEELYNLLDAMPLTSRELAEHADTIVDYISQPDLITGIVTNWMMKLYFGSDPEKAFLTERIVKALPAALPLAIAVENKDDIGNEEEAENKEGIENKGNVVNKENVMRFLELLIQYQPMPEAVRYLWDALSAEDRAHLLLQGLPDGIDKNPMMYQRHVETVQSPDSVLVDGIWRALKPASDARLIQATLTALITQESSQLQVIAADDGRLKGIDLYTLFTGFNTAQRKTLLECHSILDGGLIKSYIEKRRRNPGKSVPLKHLPGTVENALDNARKKPMKERDFLDLLIQAQDNSSSIRPDLLQAYSSKVKAMAAETMKKSIDSSEQQDARLTALAILFLTS